MILNLCKHGIGKVGANKSTPVLSQQGYATMVNMYELNERNNYQISDDWRSAGRSCSRPRQAAEENSEPRDPLMPVVFADLTPHLAFQKFMKSRDEQGVILARAPEDQKPNVLSKAFKANVRHEHKKAQAKQHSAAFKSVERVYFKTSDVSYIVCLSHLLEQ